MQIEFSKSVLPKKRKKLYFYLKQSFTKMQLNFSINNTIIYLDAKEPYYQTTLESEDLLSPHSQSEKDFVILDHENHFLQK